MNEIYVVMGYAGEYDDAYEWAVAAYFDKKQAEEHEKKAQEVADKLYRGELLKSDNELIPDNPYDEKYDQYGTSYHVDTIPFIESRYDGKALRRERLTKELNELIVAVEHYKHNDTGWYDDEIKRLKELLGVS